MKSKKKAQEVLRKMSFQADATLRQDMKQDMTAVYQGSDRGYRTIVSTLSFAACLVFVIWLFGNRQGTDPMVTVPVHSKSSLAFMLTSRSLNQVYKADGLEGLDAHLNKTYKLTGPRPDRLSLDELLDE